MFREVNTMAGRTFVRTLTGFAIAAVVLGGCRESEQDRFVRYEPGVYKGMQQDKALSEDTLATLRGRVGDSVNPPGGGGGTRDARTNTEYAHGLNKPIYSWSNRQSTPIDADALRTRGRLQGSGGL